MTQIEALDRAIARWGKTADTNHEVRIGHGPLGHRKRETFWLHDDNAAAVVGYSNVSWEDAFADADRREADRMIPGALHDVRAV